MATKEPSNVAANLRKVKKAQASVEYLSTFSMALIILTLAIVVIGVIIYSSKVPTGTTSSCYLSAQLNCVQLAIANNGMVTKAVLVFTNNLGVPISFGANALTVIPTSQQVGHVGNCYPANAPAGSTVVCNATISGYSPGLGTQVQPTFQISYSECQGSTCSSYSTTGQSNLYVSASAPIYSVTILTSPSTASISINGAQYSSGSVLQLVGGSAYDAYADSPSGYAFNSWSASGGVKTSVPTSPTSVSVTSSGTLEATFSNTIPITTTTSTTTSTTTTTTVPPALYYISVQADPSNGGTVSVSVTGSEGSNSGSGSNVYLSVYSGETVMITTTPTPTPYLGWASGGYSSPNSMGVTSSSSSITFTMPAQNVVEYALENPCIELSVSSSNIHISGSVETGSGNTEECDPYGSSVTLVAAPGNLKNAVGDWACGGNTGGTASEPSSTNTTCYSHAFPATTGPGQKTVTDAIEDLNAPTKEVVTFYPCLNFTASPASGGSPADTAGDNYTCQPEGTSYTFAPNTYTGYTFTSWGGAGNGGASYTGSSSGPTIAIDSYTVEIAYFNKQTYYDNDDCATANAGSYGSSVSCTSYGGSYPSGYHSYDCITTSTSTSPGKCDLSFLTTDDGQCPPYSAYDAATGTTVSVSQSVNPPSGQSC